MSFKGLPSLLLFEFFVSLFLIKGYNDMKLLWAAVTCNCDTVYWWGGTRQKLPQHIGHRSTHQSTVTRDNNDDMSATPVLLTHHHADTRSPLLITLHQTFSYEVCLKSFSPMSSLEIKWYHCGNQISRQVGTRDYFLLAFWPMTALSLTWIFCVDQS